MAAFQEDDWDYQIKYIKSDSFNEFELRVGPIRDEVLKVLNIFKNNSLCDNFVNGKSKDEEKKSLEYFIERNKELRLQIEAKLEELEKKKTQYEDYKKDQKLLAEEIIDRHEAYLMAKKYYKKFLKIYYTIESRKDDTQTILVQFFTETKKSSDNYSIRLVRNTSTGHYALLDTSPKLKKHQELANRLQETNDVPDLLCSVRHAFIKMIKSSHQD